MENEFVPYEQALALKELGFDEECLDLYWHDTKHWRKGSLVSSNIAEHTKENCIKAPLYQQAFRWFREEHNVQHEITRQGDKFWLLTIVDTGVITKNGIFCGKRYSLEDYEGYVEPNSYEEAELACLRKLIEIVNQIKDE